MGVRLNRTSVPIGPKGAKRYIRDASLRPGLANYSKMCNNSGLPASYHREG